MLGIKNWKTKEVIYSGDFNSIKELLEDGIAKGISFAGANLRYADLRYANLSDANLRYADLRYADLSDANLSDANLSDANLSDANLRYADLYGASLNNIRFNYCIGNQQEIQSMQLPRYKISWNNEILNIGCETHTIQEWKDFDDETISRMDDGALEWWRLYKEPIMTIINNSKKL